MALILVALLIAMCCITYGIAGIIDHMMEEEYEDECFYEDQP